MWDLEKRLFGMDFLRDSLGGYFNKNSPTILKHGVWKLEKKSHSYLRSSSVTMQVNFDWQKLAENAKIAKCKYDFLDDFQTLCTKLDWYLESSFCLCLCYAECILV